jgi:hypothetical protein
MLTNIEPALLYFLKPIDAFNPKFIEEHPEILEEDLIKVGTVYIMNEVALYMADDDVIATVGTYPDSCIIITDLSRERCLEIAKKGQEVYDAKLKKVLALE